MGRGRKRIEGASYFSVDVDFDDDIRTIRDLHGNDGLAFVLAVKQSAFKRNDVEVQVQNERQLDGLAARCLVQKRELLEMLETAFDVGFLDREAYESRKVLTSSAFKEEFSRINHERNRKRGGTSEDSPETSEFFPNSSRKNSGINGDIPGTGGDVPGFFPERSPSPSSLILNDLQGGGTGEGPESVDPPAHSRPLLPDSVLEVPQAKPPKRPPGWREGTDEVRPGVFLTAAEVAVLGEDGPGAADYWLEQLAAAADTGGKTWREKKNHYRTALTWRRFRLEEGKRWDPGSRLYVKAYRNGAAGAPRVRTVEDLLREAEAEERKLSQLDWVQ